METQNLTYQSISFKWKMILIMNFVLGLELWLSLFTDYSFKEYGWIDEWINVFIVGTVGLTSWVYFRKQAFAQKQIGLVLCKFSTFAALPLVPFLLLTLVGGKFKTVHQVELRNGKTVIENKFVCANNTYCAVDIRLRYDFLPFLERDIYGKSSTVPANVFWISDQAFVLDISGDKVEITPGWIKFEWPGWNMFIVGLYLVYALFHRVFVKTKQVSI